MRTKADVAAFPEVSRWVSRIRSGPQYLGYLTEWLNWLDERGGPLAGLSPRDLLDHQVEAAGRGRYEVLDAVQSWVDETEGLRAWTLKNRYKSVRSFFLHNRAALPEDRLYRVRADVPPSTGTLTVEDIRRIVESSRPCYRAAFLCMFAGGMGWAEFNHWNFKGYAETRDQLSRDPSYLRINLPGRKRTRNATGFYTVIAGDALDALKAYWARRRDWSTPAVIVNTWNRAPAYGTIRDYWSARLDKLGILKPRPGVRGRRGERTGKNLHEMRDVFKTRWHRSGADLYVADFMMGHGIDPNEYDKVMHDLDYVVGEVRKAGPWLNIVSEDPTKVSVAELDELRERLAALEKAEQKRRERAEAIIKRRREG